MAGLSKVFLVRWRRSICRVVALLVACAFLLFCVVTAMRNYPANVAVVSPSGRYILENVPVGRVFMLGGMAYLRVFDRQNPQEVYRTPLYDMQSLDMRGGESEAEFYITWISFYKNTKSFDIAVPQWESHWLNIFISNTPYVHIEN